MTLQHHDSGKPAWDAAKASRFKGSIILVGMSYLDAAGEITHQFQCFGMITMADPDKGIAIDCHGQVWRGKTITLPPDLDALQPAKPGSYGLRSTGETVIDPDFTASWTIQAPKQ